MSSPTCDVVEVLVISECSLAECSVSGCADALIANMARAFATSYLRVVVFNNLGALPLFDPDLCDDPPGKVQVLRERLGRAGGVLIVSSPLLQGTTSSVSNALQWTATSGSLAGKPTAVLSTSPDMVGAAPVHAALIGALVGLGARIVVGASISISMTALSPPYVAGSLVDRSVVDGVQRALRLVAAEARRPALASARSSPS